jgi:hypothetical protein
MPGCMATKALVEALVQPAVDQENLGAWILTEILDGAALPGFYPPNPENTARYEAIRVSLRAGSRASST